MLKAISLSLFAMISAALIGCVGETDDNDTTLPEVELATDVAPTMASGPGHIPNPSPGCVPAGCVPRD